MHWRKGSLAVVAALVLATAAPAAAKPWKPGPIKYGEGVQANIPVKASDGKTLRADIHYPTDPNSGQEAKGKFPVLLTQTPYGKDSAQGSSGGLGAVGGYLPDVIKRGYIQVIADVRGTGASQGQFGLFDPIQRKDGARLARFAAKVPHSNGQVGLFGPSYMGINQFLTVSALGRHSPVKAMFPLVPGHQLYRDTVTMGGILDGEFGGVYVGLTGGLNLVQPLLEAIVQQPSNGDLFQTLADHIGGFVAEDVQMIANTQTNGNQMYEPYWRPRSPRGMLRKVVRNHVPAFMVGGWFDLFQRGEPLDFAGLQNLWAGRAVGKPMRRHQRLTRRYQLLMGPWYHTTFGQGIDMNRIVLRWFDRWLKHKRTGINHVRSPLHLYQLGSGRWLDAKRWPLNGAKPKTYFLGPNNTLKLRRPPKAGGADSLLWTGLSSPCGLSTEQWGMGSLTLALNSAGGIPNPCTGDDSTAQVGPGVASYTTKPLKHPRVIAGPIDATLLATSNRPNTEFVVTVEDVSPSGSPKPITTGALLGSFRKLDRKKSWFAGKRHRRPLLPYHLYTRKSLKAVPAGKVTRFDVEVFPTFAKLAKGHSLRVRIATSDVPHLTPNPSQISELAGGTYQLQHRRGAASYLEVPLAKPSKFKKRCRLCR